MNKKQSIASVLGFTLIVLTWLYGNGQFQIYEKREGFGSVNIVDDQKIATIKQRIKPDILIPTVIAETLGTVFLSRLLKNQKNRSKRKLQKIFK